ncbi:MAG: DUF2271 domain-containing protein [Ilumatobacteraceae bacterium]
MARPGGGPGGDRRCGRHRRHDHRSHWTAGDYSVSWNGTSYDGTLVPQGTYYLCIEAAREHGPYELIREPITVGAEGFSQTFAPVNELTAVAVTYTV